MSPQTDTTTHLTNEKTTIIQNKDGMLLLAQQETLNTAATGRASNVTTDRYNHPPHKRENNDNPEQGWHAASCPTRNIEHCRNRASQQCHHRQIQPPTSQTRKQR